MVLVPLPAAAQWGRHFSIAAGPSIGIDDIPPNAGAHVRVAGALARGPRALNLLADGYITWMAPGSREQFFPDGSLFVRDQENQFGIGVSGMLNFVPRGSVAPYLKAESRTSSTSSTSCWGWGPGFAGVPAA